MRVKISYLIILIGTTLLIASMSFTIKRYDNKRLKQIHIYNHGKNPLLENKALKKIVLTLKKEFNLKRKKINQIDPFKLEKSLQNHPFIKTAEVFFSPEGILHIAIWQHQPIGRIKNKRGEFYLTTQGILIPPSKENTPIVPLIKGDFLEKEYKLLKKMINFINKDAILKNQIIGIKKEKQDLFKLSTSLENHLVILGAMDNFKEKFLKLKSFYKHLQKKDVEVYKALDLRYKDQIIAVKK